MKSLSFLSGNKVSPFSVSYSNQVLPLDRIQNNKNLNIDHINNRIYFNSVGLYKIKLIVNGNLDNCNISINVNSNSTYKKSGNITRHLMLYCDFYFDGSNSDYIDFYVEGSASIYNYSYIVENSNNEVIFLPISRTVGVTANVYKAIDLPKGTHGFLSCIDNYALFNKQGVYKITSSLTSAISSNFSTGSYARLGMANDTSDNLNLLLNATVSAEAAEAGRLAGLFDRYVTVSADSKIYFYLISNVSTTIHDCWILIEKIS